MYFMYHVRDQYIHAQTTVTTFITWNERRVCSLYIHKCLVINSSAFLEVPDLEPCPKWEALQEVMEEISEHNSKADGKYGPGRVLIAAEDDRTCAQLQEVRYR